MIDKNNILVVAGILHAKKAFVGPEVLHVDLTNLCNFNCLACWCRSPLLEEKAMPEWERRLSLPFDVLKGVFDDLDSMGGLKQVKLVGGGEPFIHPEILTVVEYIKSKDRNIQIDINTNLSLVEEASAQRLLELEVDSLTVSIWAGSPAVYALVHPNQTEKTFYKIRDILKFITDQKKKMSKHRPRIIFHEVIFRQNCKDVENMLELALDVGVDEVQFVPVDPVRGKTDVLLLNEDERKELLNRLYFIRKRYDPGSFRYSSGQGQSVRLTDFDGFIRRMEELDTTSGAYDEDKVNRIACYAGWLFARIMTTGDVVPCCKGHRMPMGNIYKNRFKDIWFSQKYNKFRYNGLNLSKDHPYFSKIGNDAVAGTGCYNCDNLWQNIPMHGKIAGLRNKNSKIVSFCNSFLRHLL